LVRNASRTYVGADADIDVSALSGGSAGRVIVWSEDVTRFFGTVSARGPPTGLGGFVEISSHGTLEFAGDVELAGGTPGTLLLDPRNINVNTQNSLNGELTADSDASIFFADGNNNTNLNVSELTAFTTGTIVLQAQDVIGDGSEGNVVFENDVTLQAGVNLVVQGAGRTPVQLEP
jgi:hypothetical protein